jgi:hypothetical protein
MHYNKKILEIKKSAWKTVKIEIPTKQPPPVGKVSANFWG